ncbi:BUD13 protein [Blattella germanica]|nr:BUD13 protein [Blattella germanica]
MAVTQLSQKEYLKKYLSAPDDKKKKKKRKPVKSIQERQRSLTIEEILTELELLDSTQVEDVERFDITILPPDPEYDTDVDDVQDKVRQKRSQASKGFITAQNTCFNPKFRVVDDDLDLKNMRPLDDDEIDLYNLTEDAPQIAGIIDERPDDMRTLEEFRGSKKWKIMSDENGVNDLKVTSIGNTGQVQDNRKRNSKHPESNCSSSRKHLSDSDASPPRKSRGQSDSDISPQRKSQVDSDVDHSPPRRSRRPDGDSSPPRKHRRAYSDSSPVRKSKDARDMSPVRKKRHDTDMSPARRNKDADQSPARRNRYEQEKSSQRRTSPRRNKHPVDLSPPRKSRVQNDSDSSPPRKSRRSVDSDQSPPRNSKKLDKNKRYGAANDSDASPPRKTARRYNSPSGHSGRDASRRYRSRSRSPAKGRHANSPLRNNSMGDEVSGRGAAPVMRDRKTGKRRNLEEEAKQKEEEEKKQAVHKEKYSRWGKGLKQVEEQKENLQAALHEMSKPLARYADDDDLERHLRDQEREGDPMLDYIRSKKPEDSTKSRPKYQGSFLPNRFGIPPGHRWDGVDRSSGYEKQWFEHQNSRKAVEEEAYKWSTSDM